MTIKKYILLLITITGLFTSCDINEPIYVQDDISYVAFSKSEESIRENKGVLDIELYLTTYSTSPAEFSITSNSEGLDYPAQEGVDYRLPSINKVNFENGLGFVDLPVEIIDNEEKDGQKQFWIEIASGPDGYQLGIDGKEKILVTIQDDEHPLKFILGRYRISAESYFGSEYNISHDRLLIEPDADTTKILINNVVEGVAPPLSRALVGTIDVDKAEITIKSGQQWSNPNSYDYYFSFYKGDPDNANKEGPEPLDDTFILTYTITELGLTIEGFNNWGPKWMDSNGAFDSWWWWDYYLTTTLTKVEDY